MLHAEKIGEPGDEVDIDDAKGFRVESDTCIFSVYNCNSFMPSISCTLYKLNVEQVDIANYYVKTMKN